MVLQPPCFTIPNTTFYLFIFLLPNLVSHKVYCHNCMVFLSSFFLFFFHLLLLLPLLLCFLILPLPLLLLLFLFFILHFLSTIHQLYLITHGWIFFWERKNIFLKYLIYSFVKKKTKTKTKTISNNNKKMKKEKERTKKKSLWSVIVQ